MALSITWAAVGVLVTAAGLLLKRAELRTAGLAVLALASAKVFVFDLASLDIAYRVITLIVLGVLLIASALAWTRLKPEAGPGSRRRRRHRTQRWPRGRLPRERRGIGGRRLGELEGDGGRPWDPRPG